MEFAGSPNVIYLLLAGGLIFAVLSLAAPGTGLLELMALFVLTLAGVGIYYFEMPINAWALIILLIGAVLFFMSVRRTRSWPYLVASIVAIVIGSAFLFSSGVWYIPAVNPFLAGMVSVVSGVFFWYAARKAIEAESARPRHDLEALIGSTGEAKTDIYAEGSVLAGGEMWSARSDQPILAGSRVQVIAREGFILIVEAQK